ncbi:MAG TPA: SDR family oxidoreductase [Steroidobacteraceae bacterium]|jgi:NAD(P)-dependent dehydrogenase (short-subunit alcohol dehydrogenase family)|nr:SDR family oxidoreductase [Steroidobacteraceae bacterium]
MNVLSRMLAPIALGLAMAGTAGNAAAATVLITGANQGIGLEFAKEYAARGWTVIATHRRTSTPAELAKLAAQYPKVRIERMDVTDAAQIAALGAKLKGVPIDILLNNAGLVRTDPVNKPGGNANQKFGTLDYRLLDEFIHTNVAGPLMITETFIGNVKASHQKKIIAISSAAGSVSVPPFMPNGSPVPDHYWYRISKAALNSAMRLLAAQFKDQGITVVMFHPGGVQVESFGNDKLPGFVPPPEAVGKMIRTIDGLTIKDTGRFLDNDGKDHPW